MKPCRYVVARGFWGTRWCCQPGKRAAGSVYCYAHFPATVTA